MTIALVNYVRFKQRNGNFINGYYFQNFTINGTRTFRGDTYSFAPYAFNANSANRGGDRSDCAMVWPLNDIAVNLAEEMASKNRLMQVDTVSIKLDNYANDTLINTELWRVAGYETDVEKVVIRLQTPLDAVAANVPARVITEELVGALPFESNV